MKGFITSNLERWGRVLVALALATTAMTLVLNTWGGLPAAEARGPAKDSRDSADLALSSTDVISYFVFLPLVFRSDVSDVVFFDDFSSTSSGWPHKATYEACYFEYTGGRYRVKVTDYNQECMIPNFEIPKQVNGTFSVKVRRTDAADRHLLYGLIFGAGPDAFEDRWALEVYPNDDPACDNDPFFWLYAIVDGDQEHFKTGCTDAIDKDEDDWNRLKVIRNGKDIKVYINDDYVGHYTNANYLLNEGYFLLKVVSLSHDTINVEFDDFEIRSSTSAP